MKTIRVLDSAKEVVEAASLLKPEASDIPKIKLWISRNLKTIRIISPTDDSVVIDLSVKAEDIIYAMLYASGVDYKLEQFNENDDVYD